MSLMRACDKCGKTIDDDNAKSNMPDLIVMMGEENVREYEDLCDTCEDRVRKNVSRYLSPGSTRTTDGA